MMSVNRWCRALGAAVVVTACVSAALGQNQAPWSEDFEAFDVGDRLCGNGGWECWDENPNADAFVVGDPAHGGQRSVETKAASDTIAVFKDDNGEPNVTDGKWVLTAWIFVPDEGVAPIENSGFVVQNEYNHGGPYAWSVQLRFNNVTNTVLSEFDGATLPLIENEWVQIRVEIDLTDQEDPDGWQKCWYGDDLLYEKTWNCGVGACGPEVKFGSIDLWAADQPAVYYDDLALVSGQESGCQYVLSKNSKAKKGCGSCPRRGDVMASGDPCDDVKDCAKKLKIKKIDCPDGGRGFCKKIKGKRDGCV